MRHRTFARVFTVLVFGGLMVLVAWMAYQPAAETPVVVIDEPEAIPDYWSQFPGALVATTMKSQVGVLLDEIPTNERGELVKELLSKPDSYWTDRALAQVRFTTLRRNYGIKYGEKPLPLPPESLWQIDLKGKAHRQVIDGHDYVLIDYNFSSTLLSDANTPGDSVAELNDVGGTWSDTLVLPLDPEFVFQRTGFACMNESESPPNSIDAEEADFYYDQKCHIEDELSNIGCHQTEMPDQSCVDAVATHIGAQTSTMTFERLPWSDKLADEVRVGDITNETGPDLQPIQGRFEEHRVTYRYIPTDSCTLVENCVGGSGWRQLLMFPTGDVNSGAKALDIGRVDYFHQTNGSLLADHGVYEYSACHEHYHFSHYGAFTLGEGDSALNHKQAFCLQPTSRVMNNELSPLNHPYSDCIDQGVAVGWLDEYNMGLECQWLDISDVAPQTLPLSFTTNPDGMMCEGELKFDDEGHQLFETTTFKTKDGQPVDRPQCDFAPAWADNNTVSYDVDIPKVGESYITEGCKPGVFGSLRNCGLQNTEKLLSCDPGSSVTLSCSVPSTSASQVLRVCEASRALQSGIPCAYNDSLVTSIVNPAVEATFTCPEARDVVETGGLYSFFTGALFPDEASAPVTCSVKSVIPKQEEPLPETL